MPEIDKNELTDLLRKTICKVTFKKVNGDTRVMHCTLNESELPPQIDLEEHIQKKKPNEDVLAVWDVESKGWRSFRWDSIIEWSGLEK